MVIETMESETSGKKVWDEGGCTLLWHLFNRSLSPEHIFRSRLQFLYYQNFHDFVHNLENHCPYLRPISNSSSSEKHNRLL